jgi:uncharacterized repeat protein (TIGR01451 family)
VTGGYVYRGQQYPWMRGVYFYSDSGSGRIWAIQQISPGVWSGSQKIATPYGITAFGEDENGEIYVTDYVQGGIYQITSTSPADFSNSTKKASADTALTGDVLTYTIVVRNTGELVANTVRVTDVIPAELSFVPGTFTTTHGTVDSTAAPTLKWNGVMSPTSVVTLTYVVTVSATKSVAIPNDATIDPGGNSLIVHAGVVIANPRRLFLPLIWRNN